jgi:two-component system OmpR family response regulator
MSGRRRILIAEDDALIRELIRSRLFAAGYDTHTARSGREAIERMFVVRPHALLLDLNLPDLDGFAVLEALRDDLQEVAAPVLVLTGRRAPEDVRRAIALGARDYLTKDGIEATLLPRLSRMLRAAAAAAEKAAAADAASGTASRAA